MRSISVVIPTYNRALLVTRAIETVLNQSVPANEIVVVDDGSKDDTCQVLEKLGASINLVRQPNAGLSGARNTGVMQAKSEWIAFLDDDDEYTPNRLEIIQESIRRHPEAVVHMSNIAIVGQDGSEVDLYSLRGHRVTEHMRLERPLLWGMRGAAFAQGLVIRRDVLLDAGLFRKTFYEDMDLFVRLAFKGAWTVDSRCTVRLIRRPGEDLNLSSLWKSKPLENYEALVRIHRDALSAGTLTIDEKQVLTLGLATNLFELACAKCAVGEITSARQDLIECVRGFPRLHSKLKVCGLILMGPLGRPWAIRRGRNRRAIRS